MLKVLYQHAKFGGARITPAAIEKPVYDFLFVTIELFSLALTVETLQAEICRRERFLMGVGHFDRPF